jgi:hypothetical protein
LSDVDAYTLQMEFHRIISGVWAWRETDVLPLGSSGGTEGKQENFLFWVWSSKSGQILVFLRLVHSNVERYIYQLAFLIFKKLTCMTKQKILCMWFD